MIAYFSKTGEALGEVADKAQTAGNRVAEAREKLGVREHATITAEIDAVSAAG